MSRRSPALVAALLALLTPGCPSQTPPGDVLIGTFNFQAVVTNDGCSPDVGSPDVGSPDGSGPDAGPDDTGNGMAFTGTVSYASATGQAFLTVGTASHTGTLEGEWLSVEASAHRSLAPPFCGTGIIDEVVEGWLISDDEAAALPDCLVDGGFIDLTRDGGPPDGGTRDGSVSVALICGRVLDTLSSPDCDGGPQCTIVYSLTGRRM